MEDKDSCLPNCSHSELAFRIIHRHYGGAEQSWKRCQVCGKIGEQAIAKSSVTQIRERYEAHVTMPSRFTPNVAAERKARQEAGACLACGSVFCQEVVANLAESIVSKEKTYPMHGCKFVSSL